MLEQKIRDDLKTAMKAKNEFELGVLRMVSAALQNRLIEKRTKGSQEPLTDEEAVEILMREAKKRKESAEVFGQGGRDELKQKELKELEVIGRYLPAQMGTEEVTALVQKIVAGGEKNFGAVMKQAMAELKGKADGKMVSEVIKKLLQ